MPALSEGARDFLWAPRPLPRPSFVVWVALCAVVAGTVAWWQPWGRPGQRPTCASFVSQSSAQAAYRANPAGLQRLDSDVDGIACEGNRVPRDLTPIARMG